MIFGGSHAGRASLGLLYQRLKDNSQRGGGIMNLEMPREDMP